MSKDEAAEGDVNLTPRRKRWEAEKLGPRTRSLFGEDIGALGYAFAVPDKCLS
jgi:hypothetical protein